MTAPKLRFKEFNGTWKESRLKYLAVKITDGTHDTPVVQKEGIPFLTAINVKDGLINYDDIGYVDDITHKKIYERCNPEKDDLLIVNIGAGTATCARNIVDYQFSLKNVALVKPNRNLLNPIFLEQIQRKNSSKLFASLTSGGAQPFLSLKEIGKLLIKYPSLEEQTKIASFLSAVDEKISQLNQKHELLSQYKQGMMQKLFSQQIRFKADDGSEFGEWEEKSLLELSEKAMYGMNASATEYDGKNKYLRITDICESSRKFKTDSLTSPNAELEEKYKLNLGDLLFARTGASVGKSYLYNPNDGITYFAGFLIKFSLKQDKVNPYFIFVQTLTKDFDKWVATNSMRSGQPGINAEEYSSYIFKVPCPEEQTKIANFLSAVDQKIDVVAQQIEQAKQWKKGLLQQMFV